MQLKKGNRADLRFLIKDSAGTIVSNLGAATAIKFVAKVDISDPDSAALITKTLSSGITVDVPSTGYVNVNLTSADTNITARNYFFGLQITWSSTNIQEVFVKDPDITDLNYLDYFSIIENVVHS